MRPVSRRLVGEPPAEGAPASARLRYVRAIYLRMLAPAVVVYALAAVWAPVWILIVLAVNAAVWLQGFVSVSRRLAQARSTEDG